MDRYSSGGSRGGRRGRSPPPPKKNKIKREREREREGRVFRPSIKHIRIHSFIRLLNVITHYIFLPVALPF